MMTQTTTRMTTQTTKSQRSLTWVVLVASGVVAAMHVWKLPGAMEFIRDDLNMSLVSAGTLLGIVQVGAMCLGLLGSLFSERVGLRRTLLIGLGLVGIGSLAGALAQSTWQLMSTRAFEGIGFLLITLVAPPLIRRYAPSDAINRAMGWWTAFQGMAVFLAVLASTLLLQNDTVIDWHWWWALMGVISLVMIPLVRWAVPMDQAQSVNLSQAVRRIWTTMGSLMPWVLSVLFACYTLQWGAIIGFMPDIFSGSGASVVLVGVATAIVGGLNGVGNVIAGSMLNRGISARLLVITGMIAMIVTTVLIFAPDWNQVPGGVWYQFAVACLFSGVAATVPASVTRLGVDAAPEGGSASAVMGLMIHIYNAANFLGPVILSSIAAAMGTWRYSWIMTCSAAGIGLVLTIVFLTRDRLAKIM